MPTLTDRFGAENLRTHLAGFRSKAIFAPALGDDAWRPLRKQGERLLEARCNKTFAPYRQSFVV